MAICPGGEGSGDRVGSVAGNGVGAHGRAHPGRLCASASMSEVSGASYWRW
ncbi:MAG: hypothetical protein R2856_26750 [Caldilineaceae bacterium]